MTNGKADIRRTHDTSRASLRVQFDSLRRIPPSKRLELMDDLTLLARGMAREGVNRRHPGLDDAEREALFFEVVLGRDLAVRVLEHRRSRTRGAPE